MNWAIKERGYSQRRACGLAGISPRVYRYRSTRPDDTAIRERLRALAPERRRFGYRRLHILLKREGMELNHKKLYRLYKEEKLAVRKRGGAQTDAWHTSAHDDSAGTEPALVAGLRI